MKYSQLQKNIITNIDFCKNKKELLDYLKALYLNLRERHCRCKDPILMNEGEKRYYQLDPTRLACILCGLPLKGRG